jgi:phosphotransferase system enzyme I (PtsI)
MATKKKETIYTGVAVSAGIANGRVFLVDSTQKCPVSYEVSQDLREKELERFYEALKQTRSNFKTTYIKINERLGESYAKIADVYTLLLDDPVFKDKIVSLIESGMNAEYAVYKANVEIIDSFNSLANEYFKDRSYDIQYISEKLIDNLSGHQQSDFLSISGDSIVVSHNLAPDDTVSMREKFVKGFATDIGGKTSHTAIIAKGFGIPAVVGLKNLSSMVNNGDEIIVDGNKGIVIVNPSKETIESYEKEFDIWFAEHKELEKIKELPTITLDNYKVDLFANVDTSDETAYILKQGVNGIGLYRTEFLFFNRSDIPNEQEHFESYKKVVQNIKPFETIIRTIDLGGDKLLKLGLINTEEESNPFMGLRAIRFCFKYPQIFTEQLKGILRASAFGKIKIMYPMISGIEEIRMANKILQQVKDEFRENKIDFDENIEVGAMIEVPSAAMITDILSKELDFISIGTNDLIQYTLAVDRVNEDVAYLYDPIHPAIVRLLKKIIDDAHNAGIKAAMCGEMAGDPFYTPLLLGLGLDEFSVSSMQAPTIKKIIRSVKMSDMKILADKILQCGDRKITEDILIEIKNLNG